MAVFEREGSDANEYFAVADGWDVFPEDSEVLGEFQLVSR